MGLGFKGGFAAFVDGATKGADRTRQIERQEAEDAWVKSQRDATLEKQNEEKQQRREIKADSAPAKVEQGDGGAIKSEVMDNRDVGLPENEALPNGGLSPQAFSVQGKSYGSQAEADAAAKTYDDGRGARVAQRLYQQGRPDAAMALESNQLTLLDKQRAEAKAVMEEGAEESARAARTGDGSLFAQTFNKQGKFKIGGDPVVAEELREVPGMGKVKTFNYTVDLVGPDGVKTKKQFNSHDLSMQTLKFKELLANAQKGEASEAKQAYQQAIIDVKQGGVDNQRRDLERRELQLSMGVNANGVGSGGRGGSGGSGKAPAASIDQAQKLLEDQLGKPDGSPENALRNTQALQSLDGIYRSNPDVSPRTAAFVAADIANNKGKLTTQFNPRTGDVSQVYQNPEVERGKTFVIKAGSGTMQDIEKVHGKEKVTGMVMGMVDGMLPEGTPEVKSAARAQLTAIASDPAMRASYLKAAKEAGKDADTIQRQLNLISQYPALAKKADKPAASALSVGGMAYTPPAGSPAAVAQALREKNTERAQQRDTQAADVAATMSRDFRADSQTMAPVDLVRKYDTLRGRMSAQDAAALQAIERKL